MGLSIGIHLLNLLAIPAIVLIYYFKKYKVTISGVIGAIGIAAATLASIMYILIPGLVKFAALFERFFINVVGLPYWYGVIIYFLIIAGLIVYGIHHTQRKGKVLANTIILMITVIIIGYSSYTLIVIRSSANLPMDQNNPETMFNLLSYLNREQYGDRPLIYGQYFNAPIVSESNGKSEYIQKNGKYVRIGFRPKYHYKSEYKTLFPRMYSNQSDHIKAYLRWTNMKEEDLFEVRTDREGNVVKDRYGEVIYDYGRPKGKPAFTDNLIFFIRYQLGYMYLRYFLWNFSGRQNDIQGNYKEDIDSGNWITGMKFFDAARLGNQDKLPGILLNNRARNRYFMLPLVLGLLGLFFQFKEDKKNFWVVMALFFFTGIAIVMYLNQTPLQPRERDYAYAGSFYAFSIWIGMAVVGFFKAMKPEKSKLLSNFAFRGLILTAVLGIFDFIWNKQLTFTWTILFILAMLLSLYLIAIFFGIVIRNDRILAVLSSVLCLTIPVIMASENWNDHDRSGRYIARDFAKNYLNSCERNAILYTNGDNDTFPLWYAQEVEGVRTDIRVINLSYLSADWYIEQMRRKAYESEPVKMTLTPDKYQQGKREIIYLYDRVKGYIDLKEAIQFIAADEIQMQLLPGIPEPIYYLPQHKLRLHADSALVFSNGTIKPEMANKYVPDMKWELRGNYITKNHLMALDFLVTNNWERPICYAITVGDDNYTGLDDYFEMDGLAYRVIPALARDNIIYSGGINATQMYKNMMEKFKWGGIENYDVYLDENCLRMLSNMRHNFGNLATALIKEGKVDSARQVMERCLTLFPDDRIPFDLYMLSLVDNYYKLNDPAKAHEIADAILKNTYEELDYLLSLKNKYINYLDLDRRIVAHVLSELIRIGHSNGDKKFSASIQQRLEDYGPALNAIFN
jgi:L-rhamnose mutarotase